MFKLLVVSTFVYVAKFQFNLWFYLALNELNLKKEYKLIVQLGGLKAKKNLKIRVPAL
jgi:hypothetical protein